MLFTYKYVTHEIERYQGYLDHLFYHVWYKAKPGILFSDELLAGHPELRNIYKRLFKADGEYIGKTAYRFASRVEIIYNLFADLDQDTRDWLLDGYNTNNEIQHLCSDKNFVPLTYKAIKAKNAALAKALESFYSNLYKSGGLFEVKPFGWMYKKVLRKHYNAFTSDDVNDIGVCPFCGLNGIKGKNDRNRDAYDHYFPKSIYPFTSINFLNLIPMCNECNSSEKGTLEPIFADTSNRESRVLAYYPFAKKHATPKISVTIGNLNKLPLTRKDIKITVTSPGNEEQLDSWLRVFGLEDRYKGQLTKKKVGRAWLERIFRSKHINEIEIGKGISTVDHSIASTYSYELENAEFDPLVEKGFLKSEFLKGCNAIGMFGELSLGE